MRSGRVLKELEDIRYKALGFGICKQFASIVVDEVWCTVIVFLSCFTVFEALQGSIAARCQDRLIGLHICLDVLYFLDIVMYVIMTHTRRLDLPEINMSQRPTWVIFMELVALLPVHMLVQPITAEDALVNCLFRVNRALKIFRVMKYNQLTERLLLNTVLLTVIQLFITNLLIASAAEAFYGLETMLCNVSRERSESKHVLVASVSLAVFTGNQQSTETDVLWEISTILGLLGALYSTLARRAMFVLIYAKKGSAKINFMQRHHAFQGILQRAQRSDMLLEAARDEFNLFWEKRRGYKVDLKILDVLPPSCENSIRLDMSWPLFIHSTLFRRLNLPFLRHVSYQIQKRFYFPGEYIYKKYELKNKLIYVSSGVIQILSNEDDESPIMSFTAGTCLGETSLFLSYKSSAFVRCETYCELYILKRKNFVRHLSAFRRHMGIMRSVVQDRYRYGKELQVLNHQLIQHQVVGDKERFYAFATIVWLKNTLHKLMSRDKDSVYRHDFKNIYLLDQFQYMGFERLVFSALFLDTLAIADRVRLDKDSLFVKQSFPFLLQPKSFFVIGWEVLISACALLLSIGIPYTAFVSKEAPAWYTPLYRYGTLFCWLDVVLMFFISMRGPNGLHNQFDVNVKARFLTRKFWLAVFCALPMEMFSSHVLFSINDNTKAMMHMNRALKIVTVIDHINSWKGHYKGMSIVSWLLILMLMRIYWVFGIFCLFMSTRVMSGTKLEILFRAAEFAIGVPGIRTEEVDVFLALALFAIFGIWTWLSAGICATILLNENGILSVQETIYEMKKVTTELKASAPYQRALNYLVMQYQSNGLFYMDYNTSNLIPISKFTQQKMVYTLIRMRFARLKFFKLLGGDFLLDLSMAMTIKRFPPNELLIHAGDVSGSIYILEHGKCDLQDERGNFIREIGEGYPLNILEVLFHRPNYYNCVSRSHVRMVRIRYTSFQATLLKHWNIRADLLKVITRSEDIQKRVRRLGARSGGEKVDFLQKYLLPLDFWHFKNADVKDSFEEYGYHIPFDRLGALGAIRYILLRRTLMPEGSVLYAWEISRLVFAFLSSLGYFWLSLVTSPYKYVLVLLDIAALIDIYARLHVCYYDDRQLLITHPLSTAKYYITHGFFADIMGVIPFNFLLPGSKMTEVILNIPKLFQMHRYIQFLIYDSHRMFKPSKHLQTIMYIPPMVVMVNVLTCFLFLLECDVAPGQRQQVPGKNMVFVDFKCMEKSVMSSSPYQGDISLFKAHAFLLWVMTTILSDRPSAGYRVHNNKVHMLISCVKMFSLFGLVMMFCRIYTMYAFCNSSILEMQLAKKKLVRWLKTTIKSHKLINATLKTQSLRWMRRSIWRLPEIARPFPPPLRTDILEECYGAFFKENTPFQTDTRKFYRSLLPRVRVDVIIKNGFLQTINDVEEHVYILGDGVADVLAADGSMLSRLGPGSIFGNLENTPMTRIRPSIIGVTHTSVFCVKTITYYAMMSFTPDLLEEFEKLKFKDLWFIRVPPSEELTRSIQNRSHETLELTSCFLRTINRNTTIINVWTLCYLLFPCYLGVLLDLYQLTVFDFSASISLLQYICDVIFLLDIVITDRLWCEDVHGFKIVHLPTLKTMNRQNNALTYFKFACLVPLDFIFYNMPIDHKLACGFFIAFRFYKLLRYLFFREYVFNARHNFRLSALWLRIVFIISWMFLVISCLVYVFSFVCIFEKNLNKNVPQCILSRKEGNHEVIFDLEQNVKFELYLNLLFIIVKYIAGNMLYLYYPIESESYMMASLMIFCCYYLFTVFSAKVFAVFYESYIHSVSYYYLADSLEQFLKNEQISYTLAHKSFKYMQLMWFHWSGEYYPKTVMNSTSYLKDALLNNAYAEIVTYNTIFRECHKDFVRQIVQKLHVRIYCRREFIQYNNMTGHTMYFIYKGQVAAIEKEYSTDEDATLVLRKGASFGIVQSLFYGKTFPYCFRCIGRSIVLSLNFLDWKHLLEHFPASKHRIYTLAAEYDGL